MANIGSKVSSLMQISARAVMSVNWPARWLSMANTIPEILIKVMKNREMSVDIVTLDVRCDFCNKCVDWCLARAIEFVSLPEAAAD